MKFKLAFVISLFITTSCSKSIDNSVEQLDPDLYRVEISIPKAPKISPSIDQQSIVVYLIKEMGLRAESAIVETPISAQSVIDALTSQLGSEVLSKGLRSSLTARDDLIKNIETIESTTIIDLDTNFDQLPGDEQLLMLGQIVLSILSNTNSTSVKFTSLGSPLTIQDANGNLIDGNAMRSDYIDLVTK